MGLERMASALQQVPTNYDTDLFVPIHERLRELLGHDPDAFEAERFSYQVIADHSRAAAFLVADGVLPSNEGRGYVLRRIIRRAVRHGRLLGRSEPFLHDTAEVVIDIMAEAYPHLVERRDEVLGAIVREERQFARTLDAGMDQLEEALIPLTPAERVVGRRAEGLAPDAPVLPGAVAFKLHDTYGFPIDLTVELAAEHGVRVDLAGFEDALAEQRDRSRSGRKTELARRAELGQLYAAILDRAGATEFLGYETTSAQGRVVAIVRDGIEYEELEAVPEAELREPASAEAEVVLDRTPFYAESGGQVGDVGALRLAGGADVADAEVAFTVTDTQRPAGTQVAGLTVHRGRLHGRLRVGDTVEASIDAVRRARTMRNHTGTHLLHRALRNVVGPTARQAGSLVHPDYLRFDYPGDRALTDDERQAIEAEVRAIVRDDRPVTIEWLTMDEAIAAGADAFFDEKYGERVRTIRVEAYSHELCGGTHCRATGQIGGFAITGERSIGSGMRRIEAVTGDAADALADDHAHRLERAAALVGATSVEALEDRIAALQEELRDARRRLKAGGAAGLLRPGELVARAEDVGPGIRLVAHAFPYGSIDELKSAARDVREVLGSGVIALGLDADEPQLFVTVSDDLVERGVSAGDLVRSAVAAIDGRGGGRAEMAQGKGSRRDGLGAALTAVGDALRNGGGAA
jgi:alanyl-tRNA synthetase